MNYDLTTPCGLCPFRNDSGRLTVAAETLFDFSRGEFACHQTCTDEKDEDSFEILQNADGSSQHCAGALIFLEKQNKSHQMMRICERLGRYDRTRLDMNAPVFASIEEAE